MEEDMKGNINKIKKMDMAFFIGMKEYIKDIGRMENSMVKANFLIRKKIHGKKASGKKEKELNGLNKKNSVIFFPRYKNIFFIL